MIRTTRAQRVALFRVFQRDNASRISPGRDEYGKCATDDYRAFLRTVRPYFGGECIMVPRWGMWLGIERDGYTHS
jgi:hypothetical protein